MIQAATLLLIAVVGTLIIAVLLFFFAQKVKKPVAWTMRIIAFVLLIFIALLFMGKLSIPNFSSTQQTETAENVNWIGTYEYSEFAPSDFGSDQTWVYKLTIYQEENQLKSLLDIDGLQTLKRIQAIAEENNGNLDILFEEYLPEDVHYSELYQKGDLLFSLQKVSDKNYKIIWNKLISNLLNPGNAEFKKIQDETADWNTYTNEEYGFEIKYPLDFIPIIDKYSKELIWLQSKSQPEILEPFIAVGQEKYTLLFQGTWLPVPYSQAGTAKIISSENITINGLSFNKDLWSIRPEVDDVISYNINHNGKYYTIYRGISSSNDVAVLNQMLSTFKFIENDETAAWQTYQWNNLEFKYPSTWTVKEAYYSTAAQQAQGGAPENIGVEIFPSQIKQENDFIAIGGYQVSCSPAENHTKCYYFNPIATYIYTDSNNPEVLNVFDQLISTLNSIEL